jgi:hypothetical protein
VTVSAVTKLGFAVLGYLDYLYRTLAYRDIPLIGHPDGMNYPRTIGSIMSLCRRKVGLASDRSCFAVSEMGLWSACWPTIFSPNIAAIVDQFSGIPAVVYNSPTARAPLAVRMSRSDRRLDRRCFRCLAFCSPGDQGQRGSFRQTRSGKSGPFTVLRFRTMVANAERMKQALLAQNVRPGLPGKSRIARDKVRHF